LGELLRVQELAHGAELGDQASAATTRLQHAGRRLQLHLGSSKQLLLAACLQPRGGNYAWSLRKGSQGVIGHSGAVSCFNSLQGK
jgi:hypothetical protein